MAGALQEKRRDGKRLESERDFRRWRTNQRSISGKLIWPAATDNDEVIDQLILRNIEHVSTAGNKKLNRKPGRPLVSINEAMVAHHAFKQGSGPTWR
jgi:hypothetical protein